jgi:hypothetical protein
MLFFDPDNLQFTVMRETNDKEPAVLVRIVGFASHDEANLFSNQLLALHGETQSQTVH